MQEVEAMEFFDRVVGEDDDQEPDETVILEHESGAALEVAVVELERNQPPRKPPRRPTRRISCRASTATPLAHSRVSVGRDCATRSSPPTTSR
jgi:hypothetical protein